MSKNRLLSWILAGVLSLGLAVPVSATSVDDKIADVQAAKQETQSDLNAAESKISSLEDKKREFEVYLNELNAEYVQLSQEIEKLENQSAEKKAELKKTRKNLKKAQKKAEEQYDGMKKRISYMYENGNTSYLEALCSSESFAEMITRAENIRQISQYDKEMLDRYAETQKQIKAHENQVKAEKKEVEDLQTAKEGKQQEVQELVHSTSDNIAVYAQQISDSQAQAQALIEELTSQELNLNELLQAQAAEKAAAQAEAEREKAAQESSGDSGENDVEDVVTPEEPSGDDEESEEPEQEPEEESDSEAGSGQGTYLGNFTLTAYCNCAKCCGTAGNKTASGTWPSAGRTVAMAGVPFGTQLLINGHVYTVEDLGTPYGHVDIFFNSHAEALSFGRQSAEVYRLS